MPPTAADVRRLIDEAVHPRLFFARGATRLEWEHVAAEDVSWEVFRGRLLPPAQTRERRLFESWNVYLLGDEGRSGEPLLSVKWDAEAGQVHVVRAILSYVHEGYDAGDNVILSREVRRWVRELVGTAELDRLGEELPGLLFRAVVGTSRLPLTSVEAPLPAFSLGELGYFFRQDGRDYGPMTAPQELIDRGLSARSTWSQQVKLLEAVLRAASPDKVPTLTRRFTDKHVRPNFRPQFGLRPLAGWFLDRLRDLFNGVSLSPYTHFVGNALRFAAALESDGVLTTADLIDFLGRLLRQTCRHLTAYDLVLFHHRGANYPDALLLDEVLTAYLSLIEKHPDLFLGDAARLRRRALRQAWLLRARYAGHAVPDLPTSSGENARVLPAPFARVPEEQILQPATRTRTLYAEALAPGARAADTLRLSIEDLAHPLELRELGTALYLDRPLGAFKAPGEPDATLLFSYVAFSRTVAAGRLRQLADLRLTDESGRDERLRALAELPIKGLPVAQVSAPARPGVVSLADARKVAEDFVFLHTTATSVNDFRWLYAEAIARDFDLSIFEEGRRVLIVGGTRTAPVPELVLTVYDAEMRKRLELTADPRRGFVNRNGVEVPCSGLRVTPQADSSPGSHG